MVVRALVREVKAPRIHTIFPRQQPAISLLTDFGRDEAVHLIKSASRFVNPRARIRDITHEVPAFNILSGAWRLSRVVTDPTQREGTIYVAVVDPGVGGERACLIVRTKAGKYLVGPDNGLLSLAFQKEGIDTAVAITNSELTLRALAQSVTFDGKDVFGPAAAYLAAGVDIKEFGEVIPDADLRKILLDVKSEGTTRTGSLVDIDAFGTLRTNMPNHFAESDKNKPGNVDISYAGRRLRRPISVKGTFEGAVKGELLAVLSSTGCLDIAANLENTSRFLGVTFDHIGLTDDLRPITKVSLSID